MNALVVLGGDAPSRALLESCAHQADLTIAADRGLEAFAAAGIVPELLIGDMDSVDASILRAYEGKVDQTRLCCQKDDTDGEAALNLAARHGAKVVTFLGALGGRMDHALANLMLLNLAHRLGIRAQILDEHVRILRVDGECVLSGAKGDTVSLLPLGEARGVTLEGFFYPLEHATLTSTSTLGVSNVVNAERAAIYVEEGDLLLFHYYA